MFIGWKHIANGSSKERNKKGTLVIQRAFWVTRKIYEVGHSNLFLFLEFIPGIVDEFQEHSVYHFGMNKCKFAAPEGP